MHAQSPEFRLAIAAAAECQRADLASTASGTMRLAQVCDGGVCRRILPAGAACGGYVCFRRSVDGHARICHGAFVGSSLAWLWHCVGRKARYGTMHRCRHAVVSCMEAVAFLLHVRCTEHVACYLLYAARMMRLARKANGSPWSAEGTNRTEFPCGFSSAAAVCRTCRTLALMVVPHLPVIRAAAPPGILNAPLPTAAPGPHSAPRTGTQPPSPHSAPAPPHSYPGTGPPVPDQSPSLHFCPGGLGPDPSPQLPRDRALCLTRPHRRPPSFHRPSSRPGTPQVFPPTPWSRMAGAFRARSFKFRAIACAS